MTAKDSKSTPKKAEDGCQTIHPVVMADLPVAFNPLQQCKSMPVELQAFLGCKGEFLPQGCISLLQLIFSFANHGAHVIKSFLMPAFLPGKTDSEGKLPFETHLVGLNYWVGVPANGHSARECLGQKVDQPSGPVVLECCVHTGRYRRVAISSGEFEANPLHGQRMKRGAAA